MAKRKRTKPERGGGSAAGEAAGPGSSAVRGRARGSSAATPELPAWLPWAVYGLATVVLFAVFIFSSRMLYGGDTMALGYMARKFYADELRAGHFPLWNPLLLGGTPFLEALSGGDSLYPTAVLLLVVEPFRALGWKLVLHVFAAGPFMYAWTRRLGASRSGALVAGLAYMMAPYFVTLVFPGHDGKMFVTALTPLLFWAMEATFPRPGAGGRLLPYVGVAAVVALVILTTHFQMAYFLFIAAGVYYAFRCLQEMGVASDVADDDASGARRRTGAPLSRFGIFLAASVLGAAAAGIQLIPALQYATQLSRRTATTTSATAEQNKEYAAQWSLHPEEVAAMVVPEFVGNSSGGADWTRDTYWGRNFFKLDHNYAGLVVLLLAGVSFFGGARPKLRILLAAGGLTALLYAMGAHTPVWHLAYAVLPGIKLFRAASMAVFLFGFAAATLAAFGVDRLLELRGDSQNASATSSLRFLWIAAGVLALGVLLAASGALTSLWTSTVYRSLEPDKVAALTADLPFIRRGAVVALVLALGTAGIAWAALRGTLPASALVAGLALLVAVDEWRVDAPFIRTIDAAQVTQADPIQAELVKRLATEPPFRVSAIGADQDVQPATFGIPLAGGHHPNDLQRYRELVGMAGSGPAANLQNENVLRLLAVQYLIWPTAQVGGEPSGVEILARSTAGGQPYQSLLRFPGLPRARLVGAVEVVPDERAVPRIADASFDPGTTAVLAEPPAIELPGGPVEGTVRWLENGVDRIHLTVDSPSNALLVVADNWYPAWKATVNGRETPVLRAYYALRAIPVAAGHHDVVLWYDAGFLRTGILSTAVAGTLLLGLAATLIVRERRVRSHAA